MTMSSFEPQAIPFLPIGGPAGNDCPVGNSAGVLDAGFCCGAAMSHRGVNQPLSVWNAATLMESRKMGRRPMMRNKATFFTGIKRQIFIIGLSFRLHFESNSTINAGKYINFLPLASMFWYSFSRTSILI